VRTNFLIKVETRIAFLRAIRSLAKILRRHKLPQPIKYCHPLADNAWNLAQGCYVGVYVSIVVSYSSAFVVPKSTNVNIVDGYFLSIVSKHTIFYQIFGNLHNMYKTTSKTLFYYVFHFFLRFDTVLQV
jgi:hypothetical protein